MVSLILLVGHLWTCSRGGSVYTEVSVFTTAAHTWFARTLIIWTLSRSDSSSSSCSAIWGQAGAGQLLPPAECECFNYIKFLPVPSSWTLCRGPWVRELRRHVHPSVAAGRDGPLPVQRLRTLPQDERPEPAPHQAQTETGEFHPPQLHSQSRRPNMSTKQMTATQFQESYIFPMIFLELFVPLAPRWSAFVARYNTATIAIVPPMVIAAPSDTVTDTRVQAALLYTIWRR